MKPFRSKLFVVFVLLSSHVIAQQNNVISATTNPKGWIIKTKSSSYQLITDANGNVKPGYYGAGEQADYIQKNAKWYEGINEVPVRGGSAFKTPMLEVVFNDEVRDADLVLVNADVVNIEGRSTLKITQKDRFYPLEVVSFIRVLPEFDILEKWAIVKNTGQKGNIKIENLQSGSIVLPADDYMLTHLAGKELHEFQVQETLLTPGLKVLQNKTFKANQTAPWFMIYPKNTGKDNGPAWFGSLHYSGNWQLTFDKSFDGYVQVVGGINFWDTSWTLKPGTTLETPKITVGYTKNGAEGAAQSLTSYVRKEILPANFRNELRPVLYNSWEAVYYSVNEKQQLELVKNAKDIGVELFVIDDGWFKGRTDGRSQSGLGNWEIDRNKFPNGLTPVIKEVHNLGMKFGLWVEPENVNPNSDVYLAHPDWVFQVQNRTGNQFRKILNLANEGAYKHLLETFTKLLSENEIDFIKWDQNNYLSEPGWPNAPKEIQREARIRHIENVYRLVTELRKKFPKVSFESCASGGGRVDLGMLSRMDQAWLSDNTDPLDRLYIQYGYLGALPANTMVSWITSTARHEPMPLAYRFDVAMAGVLGVGANMAKWTEAEKAIAKKKIEEYKIIRPLVQQGELHRLISPYDGNKCALQYNAPDNNTATVMCYNLGEYLPNSQFESRSSTALKFKGLNGNQLYQVQKLDELDKPGTTYKGDFLMNIGIAWPVKGANKSQVLLVTAVK
jgi:alpha-galactosidase